ncbi:MAG: FAD:protein FMN transferase [Chloroflexota bacterium]
MNTQPYPHTWRGHSFRAMGCQMSVWLELTNKETSSRLLREAEATFSRAERRLSRFDPHSELSQLNANPGTWVPVSDLLWRVVMQARHLARETDGLFDPTLLHALEAAGYKTSFAERPFWQQSAEVEPASPQLGQWEEIQVHAGPRPLAATGIRLDLGGIAKGRGAAGGGFLSDWGPCLVDASGDLTAGEAPTGWPGWPVAVAKPSANPLGKRETRVPALWLVQGTMAASGIDYRRWQQNGRTAHHH